MSDAGVTDADVAYLVMELLTGASLAEVLKTSAKLPPRRCLEILGPVCDALAEAHGAGLVHRDIKPENIFLHRTPRGEEVKVLDFGIAKLMDSDAYRRLTATGQILGTPSWMAPEQARGEPVDATADIYAVGLMAYRALAGRMQEAGLLGHGAGRLVLELARRRGLPVRDAGLALLDGRHWEELAP